MEPPHAGRSPTPPCIRSSEKLQLSRLQLVGAIHTWNTERNWTDRVMAGSRAETAVAVACELKGFGCQELLQVAVSCSVPVLREPSQ